MKREVNMRLTEKDREESKNKKNNENNVSISQISTDPMGSWTGVPEDPFFGIPIQDVDDL